MDFLLFCGLTQKNDLFQNVLEYILKHDIYIHVHFLQMCDISLIDELFNDDTIINKDNKLLFLKYME